MESSDESSILKEERNAQAAEDALGGKAAKPAITAVEISKNEAHVTAKGKKKKNRKKSRKQTWVRDTVQFVFTLEYFVSYPARTPSVR